MGGGLGLRYWQARSAHWSSPTPSRRPAMLNHRLDSAGGAA
jgi:hypothetical protein